MKAWDNCRPEQHESLYLYNKTPYPLNKICFSLNGSCKIKLLLTERERKEIQPVTLTFKNNGILQEDEEIEGIMMEWSPEDTLGELERIARSYSGGCQMVPVNSINMYLSIQNSFEQIILHEALVNTRYKTVDRKVKPVAVPLPTDSTRKLREVATNASLRDPETIGHMFTEESLQQLRVGGGDFLLPQEEKCFREMLKRRGKAFAFSPTEIGCVDPNIVEPMIILTVPHIPWNLN